ncbi:MAG: hypothetical protein A2539_08825 [Elusimicrobia bacterium RIFOXYD2_FULL_34_15]|nr:MAG: hypothetical protein A2539_08825 [Elusimicrobia bacterium RIFOXYD2_FULL_34_15]
MLRKISSLSEKGKLKVKQVVQNSIGFGILIILLITGCATTKISSVWKDQTYQDMPRKIMIIGIAKKPANKRTLEDEFVKQINLQGTDAVVSYNILPEDKDGNKEIIAAKMKELGADAVLITRIASRETVYTNHAGSPYSPPTYYGTWTDYYEYGRNNLYSPGYVEETKYALMETNIYDAGNNKMIWSASSATEISGTDQKFIQSYVSYIVKNMVEQKLLK